jgi:predicted aminopeptidase
MILEAPPKQCLALTRLGLVLLLLATTILNGCALAYYGQAVRGQLEILSRREPIIEVVEHPQTDPQLAQQLRNVLAARHYAVETLRLPDNGSYSAYADLERQFVVWNVIAAGRFSVDAEQSCFIFVGCLSYRGFFREEKALAFAHKLKQQGMDAYVGGVAAYSTLGVFKDPVLNTMLSRGELYVASTLFHELAHQVVYVNGDSAFNEALATVVEEYATISWLNDQRRFDEAEAFRLQLIRRDGFGELIEATRERLKAAYGDGTTAEKQRRKDLEFAELQHRYADLKQQWGGYGDYDRFFSQSLNNAHLAAVATYRRWVPGMRLMLDPEVGLQSFLNWAEAMGRLETTDRLEQLLALRQRALEGAPNDLPFAVDRPAADPDFVPVDNAAQ